jgi:nitrogen fixation/metabolism regulation signal transduction histidine kinase
VAQFPSSNGPGVRPDDRGALNDVTCRALVHSLTQAVVLVDERLRVVLANPAAASLFQMPCDRLIGASIAALVPHGNLVTSLRDFHDRRSKVIEVRPPVIGRGRAAVALKITATRLEANSRECRLLVLEDVSEQAMLEHQLVESEKRAAMAQLAAGILHEVSNPLTGVGSNLMFVRDALGASRSDDVSRALDASLDQLEQVRQLLDTLTGFTGRPAAQYEPADLHDVVRRCLTFVSRDLERRRIQLTVGFAPVAITCEMDVRLMKQVLLNLLKNATEAMPGGGRLGVRTLCRAANGHEPAAAVIEIADTGVGIAEPDLRKVFRPLFSTKPRGAGLGLSFCRQAVEEHGGEIRLLSRGRGHGTAAIISLPLSQGDLESERES